MRGCAPLNRQQQAAVIQAMDGAFAARNAALFVLGCKTGFRIAELLSLNVADVIQAGRITDYVTVARRYMKGNGESRTVLLNSAAKKALAAVALNRRANEPLFLSRHNNRLSPVQAWRILKNAFALASITGKTGTHSMRKSFAAEMYSLLKGDLPRLQKAMGHRNINSTVSYISFSEADIEQAILAL